MEPEITPEPTADERRAILAALDEEEPSAPPGYRSRWREAALEEGVSADVAAERDSAISD
jgi:hypothetical protein